MLGRIRSHPGPHAAHGMQVGHSCYTDSLLGLICPQRNEMKGRLLYFLRQQLEQNSPYHPTSTSGVPCASMVAWAPPQEPELWPRPISFLCSLLPFDPRDKTAAHVLSCLRLWEWQLGAPGCWCTVALTSLSGVWRASIPVRVAQNPSPEDDTLQVRGPHPQNHYSRNDDSLTMAAALGTKDLTQVPTWTQVTEARFQCKALSHQAPVPRPAFQDAGYTALPGIQPERDWTSGLCYGHQMGDLNVLPLGRDGGALALC